MPTMTQALVEYEQWRTKVGRYTAKTWAGEKPGLAAFVHFVGADADTSDVNAETVEGWWNALALQESTLRTRLHQLRSFITYLQARQWLTEDPTLLLRAPKPYRVERERLNAEELLLMLEQCSRPVDRILIALTSNLALRASEVKALRIQDVDLAGYRIFVTVEKTKVKEWMPMTVELHEELERWLAHYREAVPGLAREAFLVPACHYQPSNGRTTYKPARPVGEPHEVVKDALARVGWETTLQEGVHTIRRSVGRIAFDMLVAEGKPDALEVVSALLHHSNPTQTLHYIGFDRQAEARDDFFRRQRFLTRGHTPAPVRLQIVK